MYKIYRITFSLDFLLAICMEGRYDTHTYRVVKGIPKDATVEKAYIEDETLIIEFSTSDEEFIENNEEPDFLPIFGY